MIFSVSSTVVVVVVVVILKNTMYSANVFITHSGDLQSLKKLFGEY